MLFNEFKLKDKTLDAISKINFIKPTYIQELVLPEAIDNKSLACKGKTGSGKTHCFIIPLANKIEENSNKLQAIIILPTRELAIQINQKTREFFKDYNVNISLLTGGKENEVNNPNILIGTASKIKDIAIDSGKLNLSTVETFIVDEADMTLEMGFLNELDAIASLISKKSQFLVFSATMPAGIKMFVKKYFTNPLIIEDDKGVNNDNIKHVLYPSRGQDEKQILLKIINHINPYICLIFLSKKDLVEQYYKFLVNNGIDCLIVHGDLPARERKRNIKESLSGRHRFIVCSDIASRGIDIEGVSHVISIGFPKTDLNYYVHRAGRCGRNTYQGISYTIFSPSDVNNIKQLEKMGIKFEYQEIKHDEFVSIADINQREKRKNQQVSKLDVDIKKAIAQTKGKKVKPNYKKKVKLAVDKVKRKHKREVIENDIKKRIVARAIKRTKDDRNYN